MLSVALTVCGLAGCASAGQPSGAAPPRWEWQEVEGHPGRRFRLFVPPSAAAMPGAPLLVALHGCLQDPDDFARGTRLNETAAERGLVVAYPAQDVQHHPQRCWNWYLAAQRQAGGSEPAVIAAIVRQVSQGQRIDAGRVFVAGLSAGGAMAVNAAIAHPHLFAAVGVHSGLPFAAADSAGGALAAMQGNGPAVPRLVAAVNRALLTSANRPLLIVLHGEQDGVVHISNLAALFVQWTSLLGPGTARDDSIQVGARRAVRTHYTLPGGRVGIEAWRVEGLGHAWSGGDPAGSYADPLGPSGSRLMLDFFLSRPPAGP